MDKPLAGLVIPAYAHEAEAAGRSGAPWTSGSQWGSTGIRVRRCGVHGYVLRLTGEAAITRPPGRPRLPTKVNIPRSRHDPKILWVDDAEIVSDRITEVRPVAGNCFTQEPEGGIGELGASCVAFVVRNVSVHEAP